MIGHMHNYVLECMPIARLTGAAPANWVETFLSASPGLQDTVTCVMWTGDRCSEEALQTALAVFKSSLGYFPDVEPTVGAVAFCC